jgi:antitoxin CcdA
MRMVEPKGFSEERSPFRDERGIGRAPERIRKRAVNVTVQEEILAYAKEMKLNLSQVLEAELRKRVREERARRWAEENKEFVESYNAYIERNGVFGAEFEDWDDPEDRNDPAV